MDIRYSMPLLTLMVVGAVSAQAQTTSQSAKLSKGKAKVEFTAQPADELPHKIQNPRVGIAASPSAAFAGYLASALDEGGRVRVTPPSRLRSASSLSTGFEQLMRDELVGVVEGACREGKLDYLLVQGTPQSSTKTDVTAMVFFVGRMRMRHRVEARLYECSSRKTAWVQSVLFETSQTPLGMMGGTGAGLVGGPEAEKAMASIFAKKLSLDMGW